MWPLFQFFVDAFSLWVYTLFRAPFYDMTMLWILVPIWLSWFFAEFFQEKLGTSMGNAISNATIVLWATIDCARETSFLIAAHALTGTFDIVARYVLLALLFTYSLIVLVLGFRGNTLIKHIARIRIMTYVVVIAVPVFYNEISLSLTHIIAAIIFFPLFYGVIELLDQIVPDPVAIRQDQVEASENTRKSMAAPQSAAPHPQSPQSMPPAQNTNPPAQPPSPQNPTAQYPSPAQAPAFRPKMPPRTGDNVWNFD